MVNEKLNRPQGTVESVRQEAASASEVGQALKQQAATRAATVANIAPENRAEALGSSTSFVDIPPMFVIEGDADTLVLAQNHELAQEELRKQHEAMLAVKAEFLDKEYTFFIKCRHPHPQGSPQHGVYLKGYPHGRIVKGDEWKSGYKVNFETAHRGDIWCQVCLRYLNRYTPLDVTLVTGPGIEPGRFEINDRWLWKRPKDPRRLAVENETRVRKVAWSTGNIGVDEADARSKAAGLQVVSS